MVLVAVGINHNSAPLKIREKVSLSKKQINCAILQLKQAPGIVGVIILSTCNRTEFYVHLDENNTTGISAVLSFILENYWINQDEFNQYFYILKEFGAVRHIFRVASGLDSQVLGETQILGQIKSSWLMAKDLGASGELLDNLFATSIDTGRIVRLETRISQGNISVGTVALKLLEEKFKDLRGKSILIIGAGKIAYLISRYLQEKNMEAIFVSNRTYERALRLAADCKGRAVNFNELKDNLRIVDIVVSAAASPHLILKKETIEEAMQTRTRPIVLLDLGLPRNIDPQMRGVRNISLYDLDDLKSLVEENFVKRRQEARLAEMIVDREVSKFRDLAYVC